MDLVSHNVSKHCPACDSDKICSQYFPEGAIHICSNCQLQWAKRFVSAIDDGMDVTGTLTHYMDPESIDSTSYPPYRDFFTCLEKFFGQQSLRILDIGAGNGVFLAEAIRCGHVVRSIELDVRHAEILPPAIRDKIIFTAAETALPLIHEQFDVVTFWDSFEHIDDPYALLEIVRRRLSPRGIVFTRVNNTRDIFNIVTRLMLGVAPVLGRYLLRACFNLPQHAWNFSVIGMTRLLESCGWRLIMTRVTETPSSRLTSSLMGRMLIRSAYLVNRLIGGGKVAEYWFQPIEITRSRL